MNTTGSEIKVVGPQPIVEGFFEYLSHGRPEGIRIQAPVEAPRSPFEPKRLGMEPVVYFVVAFGAHVSAALVHDWIRERLRDFSHSGSDELTILNLKTDKDHG